MTLTKSRIQTTNAPQAIGPYSQGIAVGNFVFLSGQVPLDPRTGELVVGTVEDQAHQVLKNIAALLETANTSFEKVVKTTIFLKNMGDFATVNKVYAEYFKEPFPARSTVEVARLPRDVLVEIEVIALA